MVLISKEITLYGSSEISTCNETLDKNLLKALASFYGNAVSGNTTEFENYLVDYFKEHFKDISETGYNDFIYNFSKASSEDLDNTKCGDLFKIARKFEIDTSNFENNYALNLVVKDGLIYKTSDNGLDVIYATDKAINNAVNDLYSSSLYYKHLAYENTLMSMDRANLQKNFIKYANQNNIELETSEKYNQNLNLNRRFIKRKKDKQGNVINFKQQSC